MRASKYQGCGNDFILMCNAPANPEAFAKTICDRHFGIGADGIMWVEKSSRADLKMNYLNSDGSFAKMCGNGLRCFVRYALDEKIIDKQSFSVETDAGIIKVQFDDASKWVSLDLNLDRSLNDTETLCPGDLIQWSHQDISLMIHTMHLGTMHAVVFVDDFEQIETLGPRLSVDACFPQHINVNFVHVISKDKIDVRTFERGAGWTLSCGTGIAASALIAFRQHLVNAQLRITSSGGSCDVQITNEGLQLSGPARKIADIEVEDH